MADPIRPDDRAGPLGIDPQFGAGISLLRPDDRAGPRGIAPMSGATPNQPGPSGSPPATDSSLFTVRSMADLQKLAESQVANELEGEISPLRTQQADLTTREGRVLANIKEMFGSIQPSVEAAAQAVAGGYSEAEHAQQGIFAAASQKLNQLKQSRAAEAQALAQQMGGPVAISEFNEATAPDESLLSNVAAGSMLHTLGYAQAGEQEAQAFAGKVFPLIRTEETAKGRQYYEDQIRDIDKQITQLKGSKQGKVNSRLNDLLTSERTYGLQREAAALDKLKADRDFQTSKKTLAIQRQNLSLDSKKANRDWAATQASLENERQRIAIARNQLGLDQWKETQDLAIERSKLSQQDKQFAKEHDLSVQQMTIARDRLAAAGQQAAARLKAARDATAAEWLDAATNPQAGKAVTNTHYVPISRQAANTAVTITKDKNVFQDTKGDLGPKGRYYKVVEETTTPQLDPITDPTALVDFLVAHNIPKKQAIAMVKARLQIPQWAYGEAAPSTAPPERPH